MSRYHHRAKDFVACFMRAEMIMRSMCSDTGDDIDIIVSASHDSESGPRNSRNWSVRSWDLSTIQ